MPNAKTITPAPAKTDTAARPAGKVKDSSAAAKPKIKAPAKEPKATAKKAADAPATGLKSTAVLALLAQAKQNKEVREAQISDVTAEAELTEAQTEKLYEQLDKLSVAIVADDIAETTDEKFDDADAEDAAETAAREHLEDWDSDKGKPLGNAYQLLMRDVGKHKLLTAREEVELAKKKDAWLQACKCGHHQDGHADVKQVKIAEMEAQIAELGDHLDELEAAGDDSEAIRSQTALLGSLTEKLETLRDAKADHSGACGQKGCKCTEFSGKPRGVGHPGQAAWERMVNSNMRLVVSIAKNYSYSDRLPMVDLIQHGAIGLMKAVDKFDHNRGFKFSTYATWWIRQAITRGMAEEGSTIKIPVHVHEQLNRLRRVKRELAQELGRDPSIAELAAGMNEAQKQLKSKMHFDADRIQDLLSWDNPPVSLDRAVNGESDSDFSDFIADEAAEQPLEQVLSTQHSVEIDRMLDQLPERDATVLRMRYGLGCAEYTLEECGRKLGVTRERVRQLQDRGEKYLRWSQEAQAAKDAVLNTDS